MVLALLNPDSGIPKSPRSSTDQTGTEAEIEQLKVEHEQIQQKIEAMKTDPFWQEKIASREELNLARPDETIYTE